MSIQNMKNDAKVKDGRFGTPEPVGQRRGRLQLILSPLRTLTALAYGTGKAIELQRVARMMHYG